MREWDCERTCDATDLSERSCSIHRGIVERGKVLIDFFDVTFGCGHSGGVGSYIVCRKGTVSVTFATLSR